MAEKVDEFIRKTFPNNLLRLGVVILVIGIGIGFGGNHLLSYLVQSSTTLDFQKVNARLDAVDTRFTVDEKVIGDNSSQLRDIQDIKSQVNVIASQVSDIREQLGRMQSNRFSNNR